MSENLDGYMTKFKRVISLHDTSGISLPQDFSKELNLHPNGDEKDILMHYKVENGVGYIIVQKANIDVLKKALEDVMA